MNIRDYYETMSRLYIHQIILTVFVLLIIILPCLKLKVFLPTTGALLIIGILIFYYFIRHLYFAYKGAQLAYPKWAIDHDQSILLMIPSIDKVYKWKLFTKDGFCSLSIQKKRVRIIFNKRQYYYSIIDHKTNNQWFVTTSKSNIIVENQRNKGNFQPVKKGKREFQIIDKGSSYQITKSHYHVQIKKDGQAIMTVSQGVMPINLQKIFASSTPILNFHHSLNEEERILCLIMLF